MYLNMLKGGSLWIYQILKITNLKANRTPNDRRYYTCGQYLLKGINTENDDRQTVIYARVSTKNQKGFSCRLYGLRKYKRQIEGDEEIAKELQDRNQSVKGTDGQNQ